MNLVPCAVVSNRQVSGGNFLITLRVPRTFGRPQPGQFVHLRVGTESEPLLRRPYSLEGFVEKGRLRAVRIYFSVVGRGSRVLASQTRGTVLDLIGPLGIGFSLRPRRTPILVAGGRGVAPLLFLSRALRQRKRPFVFLFGARSRRELYAVREIRGGRLHLATDDGSLGRKGTALELLAREWKEGGYTPLSAEIFTCGPHGLLHEVSNFALERGIRCEASLEGPMACAVGACRGCPVPLRPGSDSGRYPAMCVEGPVMDGTIVDWEHLP
jgi:dihydroorotate dehydrogenase electron transfer subunit